MPYTTVYDNVIFVEGTHPEAEKLIEIKASLGGVGAQMKNLNDVKANLANQAKLHNCNCVVEFKYGQKSALFAIDDVKFYGSGVGANLPKNTYDAILKNIVQ